MPNGDWVIRRSSRQDPATTASTNQCRTAVVNSSRTGRDGERRLVESEPVLAAGPRRRGEDDDVEDLREYQSRAREVDVAQTAEK